MNKQHNRPSLRIIVKYILLQLPGQVSFAFILLIFRRWLEAPAYLTWGLLAFWIGKDSQEKQNHGQIYLDAVTTDSDQGDRHNEMDRPADSVAVAPLVAAGGDRDLHGPPRPGFFFIPGIHAEYTHDTLFPIQSF